MSGRRGDAAARWERALAGWAIPPEILDQAPEPPWAFPAGLFRAAARPAHPFSMSNRVARQALGAAGTVLDVGCGGGAAALALVPPAHHVTGVDPSAAMLANFSTAAARVGVAHREVEGTWPGVADRVDPADVVVCHHVVYNVGPIAPFVAALGSRARRHVVVELPDLHPSSNLTPLWERFWGLARPRGPSADLFVDVVSEAGFTPAVRRQERPVAKAADPDAYIAFVRRRLCLPPDRDDEIRAALDAGRRPARTTIVTVAWDPVTPLGSAPERHVDRRPETTGRDAPVAAMHGLHGLGGPEEAEEGRHTRRPAVGR